MACGSYSRSQTRSLSRFAVAVDYKPAFIVSTGSNGNFIILLIPENIITLQILCLYNIFLIPLAGAILSVLQILVSRYFYEGHAGSQGCSKSYSKFLFTKYGEWRRELKLLTGQKLDPLAGKLWELIWFITKLWIICKGFLNSCLMKTAGTHHMEFLWSLNLARNIGKFKTKRYIWREFRWRRAWPIIF